MVQVDREVVVAFALDGPGAGDPGQMAVECIGRLERQNRSARAGKGEQNGLQDLVGPVRNEDLIGSESVELADPRPQGGGCPIRVAMPLDRRHRLGNGLRERRRRRCRCLIGVQPHLDVDLGRVVALERREVVSDTGRVTSLASSRPTPPADRSAERSESRRRTDVGMGGQSLDLGQRHGVRTRATSAPRRSIVTTW